MQTNLNHCKRAHDILELFTREEGIAVALVNDPYVASRNDWRYDSSGGAAIAILRTDVSISDVEVGDGYVSATVGGVLRRYSCYAPLSLSLVGFETLLGHIEASAAGHRGTGVDVIVAGDFNAHSVVWGDVRTDLRGESLSALCASLGPAVVNTGWEPTFFLRGNGSVVDVTLMSEAAFGRIQDWRVRTECENVSDHHHITFSYSGRGTTTTSSAALGGRRAGRGHASWRTARMDADLLTAAVVACE